MEADSAQGRGARLWVGALIFLGVAGVAYQGWREAGQLRPVFSGTPAAEFRMPRVDGKGEWVLSELRGKVVMLDFWATWCPPCVAEIPLLTKLAREYEQRGLVFVAANRDATDTTVEDVRFFISRVSPELIRYAGYADDATGDRYQLKVLPTLYFIGREGQVLNSHLGQASESELRGWIEEALQGKAAARDAGKP